MTENPWARIPDRPPYGCPADLPHLEAFNATLKADEPRLRLDLSLPPEPFLGLHDARLVVLLANPGRSPHDAAMYARDGVTERSLAGTASPGGAPHHFLAEDMRDTPGGMWWRRTLRGLLELGHSYDLLARRVLAVQFHGYHSAAWQPLPITLPSQPYGFALVRRAVERGAVIVLGRAASAWRVAVPQLGPYENVVRPRSLRNAALSRGNFSPPEFAKMADALTE